jgi:hypothetical protein
MSKTKARTVPHIEVENPAEAFHKLEDFTKKILAVPKKEIDRKLAEEKTEKKKAKRR